MTTLQIFDPALCCSTGVCGVDVDQRLVDFAADALWVKQLGATVERYNLAQQPLAFAENPKVRAALEASGQEALPLVLIDGEIALSGRYPTRAELTNLLSVRSSSSPLPTGEASMEAESSCCGGPSTPQRPAPKGCCG